MEIRSLSLCLSVDVGDQQQLLPEQREQGMNLLRYCMGQANDILCVSL